MDTCAVSGGHVGSWHAKVVALLFFRQRFTNLEFYKCRAFSFAVSSVQSARRSFGDKTEEAEEAWMGSLLKDTQTKPNQIKSSLMS